jgi:hypothetical protein
LCAMSGESPLLPPQGRRHRRMRRCCLLAGRVRVPPFAPKTGHLSQRQICRRLGCKAPRHDRSKRGQERRRRGPFPARPGSNKGHEPPKPLREPRNGSVGRRPCLGRVLCGLARPMRPYASSALGGERLDPPPRANSSSRSRQSLEMPSVTAFRSEGVSSASIPLRSALNAL